MVLECGAWIAVVSSLLAACDVFASCVLVCMCVLHTVCLPGNDRLREGAFQEAVVLYGRAIDAAPAGCQAHVLHANRAAAYTRLGQHDKALADGL